MVEEPSQHPDHYGLTDHEILMELRQDMKHVLSMLPRMPTWGKLGSAAVTIAGLIFGAIKLLA